MDILIILLALFFLMFVAYRGFSVILFAPVAALLAVLLTEPDLVPVFFSGIFMEKTAGFIKLYFPVFLLGAIFGKLIEISGSARAIAIAIINIIGKQRAMFAIVLVGAVLTYGGVSLFVVAFALYPFAVELFKAADIPKRLIPGTIALGAFTFTMDALPGTPQIQNIIPTTFFHTDTWAAPMLGLCGSILIFVSGMCYLEFRRKRALAAGEGYGKHNSDAAVHQDEGMPHPLIAILPLILVGICNKVFSGLIVQHYGESFDFTTIGIPNVSPLEISKYSAVWAVEAGLGIGIITVLATSFNRVRHQFKSGVQLSVGGALLATLNTASEYGFGSVIAALPGFARVHSNLGGAIKDPLINEAVTTTTLAGITGSASGGLSIALATMGDTYIKQAAEAGISPEVMHRVAAMASGGMDTLPHNGAVITLLAITGLTHKQSYIDIFVMTLIKTATVFLIILLYYLTGII
ncbi:GntP family permease [Chitinophaga defluvii]|uniref:GntP family permease n=1 Tax=Chitinophaga defluvii TaxID=3163343 RepID=A0ABV2T618_9BACT